MRVSLSRWSLVVLAVSCLLLGTVSGCKSGLSVPGANWISWGKKPAPTTLSKSTYPQKPSTSAVPTSSGLGSQGALASYPQSNQSAPGHSPKANSGYYTGPYGTTAQSGATPSAPSYGQSSYGNSGHAATSYGQSSYGHPSPQGSHPRPGGSQQLTTGPSQSPTGFAAGPYQSPYQSQSATQGSTYAADSRSTGAYGNAAQPSGTWGGGNGTSHSPASYPQTQGQYPTTGQAQPAVYPSTSSSSYGNNAANGVAANSGSPSTTGLTQSSGPYRPGSTGRNGAVLPASQADNSSPGSGAYPSTAASSYGNYPSTGQY